MLFMGLAHTSALRSEIIMFTSHRFLRSAYVGLKLKVLLSLENSVHSNLQNISSPVSENDRILKSSRRCSF